jgi:hypothetical protein
LGTRHGLSCLGLGRTDADAFFLPFYVKQLFAAKQVLTSVSAWEVSGLNNGFFLAPSRAAVEQVFRPRPLRSATPGRASSSHLAFSPVFC